MHRLFCTQTNESGGLPESKHRSRAFASPQSVETKRTPEVRIKRCGGRIICRLIQKEAHECQGRKKRLSGAYDMLCAPRFVPTMEILPRSYGGLQRVVKR
jgi:hypothetical protein